PPGEVAPGSRARPPWPDRASPRQGPGVMCLHAAAPGEPPGIDGRLAAVHSRRSRSPLFSHARARYRTAHRTRGAAGASSPGPPGNNADRRESLGYQLDAYDLLYSRRGVVFGAVYADIHAALPLLQGLIVLCALTALACLLFAFQAIWRPAVLTGGLTLAVATVCISLYPELVHRLQVVPNVCKMQLP